MMRFFITQWRAHLPPAHPELVEGFPFFSSLGLKEEGRASTGSARTGLGWVDLKNIAIWNGSI